MTEFAKPYAGQAMSLLLGLEGRQWEMISQDASDLGLAMGVDCKANEVVFDKAYERLAKLSNDLIEKAQSGRDKTSFVAKLLEQANNFEGFTNLELSDLIVISIFGGVDTTRSQLGLGLLTFIKYPKEWIKLEKDGSLAENAFNELIRERPTTTWVTREAIMDFEFSGVQIKKGTTVHLLVHSSARDPLIDDQQEFNISKRRKKHFGFGGGAHHCVGHFMAKTDSIIALKALVKTIKDVSLNGKVALLPDTGNTSPLRLPIKYQTNDPVKN
jgi:cytochrome P450